MITERFEIFAGFIRNFVHYTLQLREVIMSLLLLIVLGGWAISKVVNERLKTGH